MSIAILQGDARQIPLPDGCVDLVITSPPYWALREYGYPDGQMGSEPTWQEWLANLVDATRDWMRVLKPEGSMFVNLGDKFSTGNSGQSGMAELGKRWAGGGHSDAKAKRRSAPAAGMPPKSLLGLPWRYALAATDQLGLILRRDIIWAKPNGLPESVTDRCRSSHEYVFHLVRSPRYYAAVDEIREPHAPATHARARYGHQQEWAEPYFGVDKARTGLEAVLPNPLGKLPGSVWSIPSQPLTVPPHLGVDHFAAFPVELPRRIVLGWSPSGVCVACGAGRRPVALLDRQRTQQTNGYDKAAANPDNGRNDHAQFGRSRTLATITGYVCACTPYTDHPGTGEATQRRDYSPGQRDNNAQGTYGRHQAGEYERVGPWREYHLDGWQPPPTRPALVLDPFAGTGTTLLAAAAYGRNAIGIDRSADYCRLARWRTHDPAERAKAMQVPKPPPIPDGMEALF